jgi:GNAT superfamily N-acetyltransferase
MNFLLNECIFSELSKDLISECGGFVCKDKDIESFFNLEFHDYSAQLLGKSYCFVKEGDKREIVCAFTVSNTSVKVDNLPNKKRNKINRKIPNAKRRSQYPAVLVGQLAVSDNFKGLGVGDELMDFIKSWFVDPLNKTGCRYIVVDAINNDKVIRYYKNNGFDSIFSSDEEEVWYMAHLSTKMSFWETIKLKLFPECNPNSILKNTRLMFFDLIVLFSRK